jgi:hypothetical protein
VILASMPPTLQKQHENMDAHIIIMYLKELLDVASMIERYDNYKKLFSFKLNKIS